MRLKDEKRGGLKNRPERVRSADLHQEDSIFRWEIGLGVSRALGRPVPRSFTQCHELIQRQQHVPAALHLDLGWKRIRAGERQPQSSFPRRLITIWWNGSWWNTRSRLCSLCVLTGWDSITQALYGWCSNLRGVMAINEWSWEFLIHVNPWVDRK